MGGRLIRRAKNSESCRRVISSIMADLDEELEPLFDYRRVQPRSVICLDDDCDDSDQKLSPKRQKISDSAVETVDTNAKVVQIVDCEEEEDWLLPPPKVSGDVLKKLDENSTIKEMRLKKQELLSFAQSAKDVLQAVEASAKRQLGDSLLSSLETVADKPSKPHCNRVKIVISVQDKDELKQFRVYMDDKFERLFDMYADKVKLDRQKLVFSFDGDKISPEATPGGLGMEDNDIIEVNIKSR